MLCLGTMASFASWGMFSPFPLMKVTGKRRARDATSDELQPQIAKASFPLLWVAFALILKLFQSTSISNQRKLTKIRTVLLKKHFGG